MSPWDHRAHAFKAIGDVTAEAICTHCASASKLIADDGTAPECLGCVVAVARLVIGPANDRFGWQSPR